MVTETQPSGEPQSEAAPDIASLLEMPEVKAAILKAAAAASDSTRQELEAKRKVETQEWEKVKRGWADERAKHKVELAAYEKSKDADMLKTALLETEAEKAAAAQLKEEALALKASVEREKEVERAIKGFQVAFPGLAKAFWDEAAERLVKGEARTSDIINEAAVLMAKPQEPGQPTGLTNRGGANQSGLAAYKDALKKGGKLPSTQEIDQMTAAFLNRR